MTPPAALSSLLQLYSDAKHRLADWTGGSEDLHYVHAGLALFVLTALLRRRRMRSPIPLAFVFVFAAGNEVADLATPGQGRLEWLVDFVNTMMWPTVLFLIARRAVGRQN